MGKKKRSDATIILNLPYPPSVNRLWRVGKKGLYSSSQAKDYKSIVKIIVKQAKQNKKLKTRLSLDITVYPPDNAKRDIDNICKVTLDSLEKAEVFINDEQIDEIHIIRGVVSKNNGYIIVKIKEIDNNGDKDRPLVFNDNIHYHESESHRST